LRLTLGLALLGFLIWRGDAQPLRVALRSTPWWTIFAAVLAYWGAQVLSAWKWQLLLRARGVRIPLVTCCRWYLAGMFWNLWMPTNVGGDGARAYLCAPRCGGLSLAVSSILIERLTGFVALLLLGVAGVLCDPAARAFWRPLAGAAAVLLLAGVLFAGLRAWSRRVAPDAGATGATAAPLRRRWLNLQAALEAYLGAAQRPALLIALALSLLIQIAQIGINIGLARAVGLPLPPLLFFWLVPLLTVASLLPVGIGGLGVREAAAVSLLAGTGAASGVVLAWSLLWQVTVWLSSLPGILFLSRKTGR
jgi:uncharacterized membrane protein YbhN (UPF0104 family)